MLSTQQTEHKKSTELSSIPLQAAQNSFVVFKQFHPDKTTYHHTFAMKLTGKLDISLLKKALLQLIHEHEALRSIFVSHNDTVLQEFKSFPESTDWPLKIIPAKDFIPQPPVEELPKVLRLLNEGDLLDKPFDLSKGPLIRVGLIKFNENEYQLAFNVDHIIVDVASQNILLKDLSTIYNSLLENKPEITLSKPSLPTLKPNEEKQAEKIQYWKKNLEGLSPLPLPTDLPAPKKFGYKGDRVNFAFSAEDVNNIMAFINNYNASLSPEEHKITLHMFFLASLYILLYRYTGETDLCLGTASANRRGYNIDEKDIQKIINCFVNSIPLRADLSGNPSFIQLVQRVRDMAIAAYQHQIPISQIVENAFKSQSGMATPFDIIFVLNEIKDKLHLNGTEASEPVELNLKNSKFQFFGLNLDKREDGSLDGFIEYNTELFKQAYFLRFLGHWKTLLRTIIKRPETLLSNLPLLSKEEKVELKKFNHTKKKPLYEEYVHELFSKRAQETPNHVCLTYHKDNGEMESIYWKDLDERINKLATILLRMGVGPGVNVGISISRSIEMIVAMLAIHKAGGVFVPLDTMPNKALDYKISNTRINIVLNDEHTKKLFTHLPTLRQIDVSDQKKVDISHKQFHLSYKKQPIFSDQIASIYYTSGTTGEPKGVKVKYAGQRNLLNAIADRKLKKGSKFLCVADIKSDALWFDITQWVVSQDSTLHLINDADRFSPEALTRIIKQENIDTIVLLPTIMSKLNPRELPSVKVAVTMGAAPDSKMIDEWLACGIEIRNEWGPTENTVCSTEHVCQKGEPVTTIGKPIRNVKIHIVHPIDGTLCPVGIPGEIVVEGLGLAEGYYKNSTLNQKMFPTAYYDPMIPKLTYPTSCVPKLEESKRSIHPKKKAQNKGNLARIYLNKPFAIKRLASKKNQNKPKRSFVFKKIKLTPTLYGRELSEIKPAENPLQTMGELKRVYRSGDQGYRMPDGNIVFLNRIDDQVKIKGNRIELGAVKHILSLHPEVADIFIIKHPTKESLAAYIVRKHEIKPEEINQEFLELNKLISHSTLPPFARLSSVTYLKALPLKSAGKVDTKALPLPVDHEEKIASPETPLQAQLLEFWTQILPGVTNLNTGVNHDFFSSGGDSPLLAKLVTKINKALPLRKKIEPHDLDYDMTIRDLEKILLPHLVNYKNEAQTEDPSVFGFRKISSEATPSSKADKTIVTGPAGFWHVKQRESKDNLSAYGFKLISKL